MTMSRPDTTDSATANHRTMSWKVAQLYVGGSSTMPTAMNWTNAFHLPSLRAGNEMPWRAAYERYIETPTSRAVTMSTAAQEKSPLMPRAKKPPRTRNLSASGSRNAPERVVPSRRASQPSSPSVGVSRNHNDTVSQLEPWSTMRSSVGTARINRAMVTRLAGVAMASSP